MSTMSLEVKDGVHVLTLTNNEHENAFNLDVTLEYLAALDAVEAYEGNTSLMITCLHEKTFSTGIDLNWLMSSGPEMPATFVKSLETVMYRLATLNVPTVMCLNGNTYAGGAILACGADFRLMRSDRGRFCFPEVNINIPFTELMVEMIDLLPNKHALKHMALTGAAYTGEECKQLDIVDEIFPMDTLQSQAFELAKSLAGKDRATYTTIKHSLRPKILAFAEAYQ